MEKPRYARECFTVVELGQKNVLEEELKNSGPKLYPNVQLNVLEITEAGKQVRSYVTMSWESVSSPEVATLIQAVCVTSAPASLSVVSMRPSHPDSEAGMEKLGSFRRLGAFSPFKFVQTEKLPPPFRLIACFTTPAKSHALTVSSGRSH